MVSVNDIRIDSTAIIKYASPYSKYSTLVPFPTSRLYSMLMSNYDLHFSAAGNGGRKLHEKIRDWIYFYVPKKSGQLQQYLIEGLDEIVSVSAKQYFSAMVFNIPNEALRPKFIKGSQHLPPAKGWALDDLTVVKDPNIKSRVTVLKSDPIWGKLYALNDPMATDQWYDALVQEIEDTMVTDILHFFNSISINITYEAKI